FLPPARHDIFKWELVRDLAEDSAARHQVSVGAIDGCALVLIVEGIWWEIIGPRGRGAAKQRSASEGLLLDRYGSGERQRR
ncbi:MAG: hypothetical protein ACYCWN_12760, partial [Ferrimicrobium sp.]